MELAFGKQIHLVTPRLLQRLWLGPFSCWQIDFLGFCGRTRRPVGVNSKSNPCRAYVLPLNQFLVEKLHPTPC